jgi:adhesin/invasin
MHRFHIRRFFSWTVMPFVVLASALFALLASPTPGFAFIGPSDLSVDGSFSDWGTVGSPTVGVGLLQDSSNSGSQDGSGFTGKASDLAVFWAAIATASGGATIVSASNLIENFYFRIDTNWNSGTLNQNYNIQLNLGTAAAGKADHMLQVSGAADGDTTEVTLVLYQYDTPYPDVGAFTTGALTGKVSNISSPYSGFAGTVDATATGAIGLYDGTNYAIEVSVPVGWFSSTYGGAITADGSQVHPLITALFSSTGALGSVGQIKDTVNDASGNTTVAKTSTTTGETVAATFNIEQIVFTSSAQSIDVGSVSAAITVQTKDGLGTARTVSSDTTIALSSTSGTGRFDASAGGAFDGSVTSVTVTSGQDSATFYYKDTTPGLQP